MLQLKTGSIYNIFYTQWKTNIKVVAFVLYPGMQKTHILNLSAIQLSTVERMQLVNIIRKLSKVPTAAQYNGRALYAIFKQYAPNAIRHCYRTMWRQFINEGALINYGLNKKEDFSEIELLGNSQRMMQQVKYDFTVNTINLLTGKGVKDKVASMFAKPVYQSDTEKESTSVNIRPAVPKPMINIRAANPQSQPTINIRAANPQSAPSITIRAANPSTGKGDIKDNDNNNVTGQ